MVVHHANSQAFLNSYLRVKTEGFSRLPNTKQVKYDLLHGEIQSLLYKEANHSKINAKRSRYKSICPVDNKVLY